MLAEGLTISTFWITSCLVGRFPLRTGLSGVAWSQRREQLVWPRLGLLVRSTYDRRVVAKGSANRGLHDAHLEAGSYLRSASGILRPLRRALRPFISCWVTGSLAGRSPSEGSSMHCVNPVTQSFSLEPGRSAHRWFLRFKKPEMKLF